MKTNLHIVCDKCSVELGKANWSISNVASYQYKCRECVASYARSRRTLVRPAQPRKKPKNTPGELYSSQEIEVLRKNRADASFLVVVKKRATKNNIPFNIQLQDIEIPKYCPVLGIPLIRRGGPRDNMPSLDRLSPTKGYVKGNVSVISFRANRIKNDATLDELEKITEWVRKSNDC